MAAPQNSPPSFGDRLKGLYGNAKRVLTGPITRRRAAKLKAEANTAAPDAEADGRSNDDAPSTSHAHNKIQSTPVASTRNVRGAANHQQTAIKKDPPEPKRKTGRGAVQQGSEDEECTPHDTSGPGPSSSNAFSQDQPTPATTADATTHKRRLRSPDPLDSTINDKVESDSSAPTQQIATSRRGAPKSATGTARVQDGATAGTARPGPTDTQITTPTAPTTRTAPTKGRTKKKSAEEDNKDQSGDGEILKERDDVGRAELHTEDESLNEDYTDGPAPSHAQNHHTTRANGGARLDQSTRHANAAKTAENGRRVAARRVGQINDAPLTSKECPNDGENTTIETSTETATQDATLATSTEIDSMPDPTVRGASRRQQLKEERQDHVEKEEIGGQRARPLNNGDPSTGDVPNEHTKSRTMQTTRATPESTSSSLPASRDANTDLPSADTTRQIRKQTQDADLAGSSSLLNADEQVITRTVAGAAAPKPFISRIPPPSTRVTKPARTTARFVATTTTDDAATAATAAAAAAADAAEGTDPSLVSKSEKARTAKRKNVVDSESVETRNDPSALKTDAGAPTAAAVLVKKKKPDCDTKEKSAKATAAVRLKERAKQAEAHAGEVRQRRDKNLQESLEMAVEKRTHWNERMGNIDEQKKLAKSVKSKSCRRKKAGDNPRDRCNETVERGEETEKDDDRLEGQVSAREEGGDRNLDESASEDILGKDEKVEPIGEEKETNADEWSEGEGEDSSQVEIGDEAYAILRALRGEEPKQRKERSDATSRSDFLDRIRWVHFLFGKDRKEVGGAPWQMPLAKLQAWVKNNEFLLSHNGFQIDEGYVRLAASVYSIDTNAAFNNTVNTVKYSTNIKSWRAYYTNRQWNPTWVDERLIELANPLFKTITTMSKFEEYCMNPPKEPTGPLKELSYSTEQIKNAKGNATWTTYDETTIREIIRRKIKYTEHTLKEKIEEYRSKWYNGSNEKRVIYCEGDDHTNLLKTATEGIRNAIVATDSQCRYVAKMFETYGVTPVPYSLELPDGDYLPIHLYVFKDFDVQAHRTVRSKYGYMATIDDFFGELALENVSEGGRSTVLSKIVDGRIAEKKRVQIWKGAVKKEDYGETFKSEREHQSDVDSDDIAMSEAMDQSESEEVLQGGRTGRGRKIGKKNN